MTPDLLTSVLKLNIAAGLAALAVTAPRKPVRIWFGARLAYSLWGLVPLAMAASLLPHRPAELIPLPPVAPPAGVVAAMEAQASDWFAMPAGGAPLPLHTVWHLNPLLPAAILWALGALAMIGWLNRRQAQFMADLARGGPTTLSTRTAM